MLPDDDDIPASDHDGEMLPDEESDPIDDDLNNFGRRRHRPYAEPVGTVARLLNPTCPSAGLAHELKMSKRQTKAWLYGERPLSVPAACALRALLSIKITDLQRALDDVNNYIIKRERTPRPLGIEDRKLLVALRASSEGFVVFDDNPREGLTPGPTVWPTGPRPR